MAARAGFLSEATAPDLFAIAIECGYDQAHLNRDFCEMAGSTPTEYLARVTRAPGWREVSG